LTNVNNKIIGVGEIGNSHFAINNQSSGVKQQPLLTHPPHG
jgi:hypothetical protein